MMRRTWNTRIGKERAVGDLFVREQRVAGSDKCIVEWFVN